MVRTQVYFTEEQHRALRQAAEREGISMTALLRRTVERELLGKARGQDYAKDAVMVIRRSREERSERHLGEPRRGSGRSLP